MGNPRDAKGHSNDQSIQPGRCREDGQGSVYEPYDLDWKEDITGTPFPKETKLILAIWRSRFSKRRAIRLARFLLMSLSSRPSFHRMPAESLWGHDRCPRKFRFHPIPTKSPEAEGSPGGVCLRGPLRVCCWRRSQAILSETIEIAKQERSVLEEAYRRTGDIQIAARELTQHYYQMIRTG